MRRLSLLHLIFTAPVVLLVALSPVPVVGQVIPGIPYGGSVEAFYQSWDIDEGTTSTTISQSYLPIHVYLPFADRFEARISSAYVSMTRDSEFDDTETVSGLADVKVQASAAFVQRRLIIGLVANLPSGSGELTNVEQDVVYDFVSPDLSVRTNRLGEGLNVGGTVSFANALSQSVTLGLGASVLSRGAYDTSLPGSSTPISLSPGMESRASATLDVLSGRSQFRFSTTYALYGTEKVNDVDNYKIGQELTLAAEYMVGYAEGRGRATFGVLELVRFDNSVAANGTLITEATSSNGNYFTLHALNEYSVSARLRITASALGRLVGPNEASVGDSSVLEAGLAATLVPSPNVALTLGSRYITGSGTGFSGRDREIKGLEGMFRTVFKLDR